MGSRSTVIQVSLLAAAVAFLVGCSSTQSPKTVQLPEPKDVPKEKWSDAMHVLTAMGVSGQRDVPIEMVGGVDRVSPTKSSVAGLGDAGLSAIGYVSPPSGMSGGAAAGVGLGLMLLGGSSDPARATQVVAWVPSDQAGSPEEASALALQKVEEARPERVSQVVCQSWVCRPADTLMVIRARTQRQQISLRNVLSHSRIHPLRHQASWRRLAATGRYLSGTTSSRLMPTRTT